MLQIVNVIGSGSLDIEVDLVQLSKEIGQPQASYDPNKHPALYLRIDENQPLITVYRTGKFNITGASSSGEIYSAKERFLKFLKSIGVIDDPNSSQFSINNYVCTGELGVDLNLNALTLELGLEQTEYEPEQFPGLVYRPEVTTAVLLLFASGRVVVTGTNELEKAEKAFKSLQDQLDESLQGY